MDKRTCRCGTEFQPAHGKNIYCSPECRQPDHATVTLTCDCCGGPAVKYRRTKQRYANTYCGRLCRDYAKYGPTSCDLPREHWARWYGSTSTWSPPVRKRIAFRGRTCNDCATPYLEPDRGTPSSYCSPRCAKRVQKRNRRAREHNATGTFTHSHLIRQYIAQGKVCAYCHRQPLGLPDPEHVLPLSRGGRNDMSNLVAACRACNTDKNDLTLTEWAADRERRGLPTVDTTLQGPAFRHLRHAEPTTGAWRNTASNTHSNAA